MTEKRTGEPSVEGLMEELLHSADADAPGDASLRNAARALGVPFAVLGAAAVTSAKASAAVAGHVAAGHAAWGGVAAKAAGGAATAGAAVSGTAATVSGAAVSGAAASGAAAGAGLGALGASGWSAGLALSVAKAVSVGLLVGGATIGTVKVVSQRGPGPVTTASHAVQETPVSNVPGNAATVNTAPLAPSFGEPVVPGARNDDEESTASASLSGLSERAEPTARTPVPSPMRAELGEPAPALALSSSVQAELDALSPARAALRAGNGAPALAALREYEVRFPSGTLRTEAEVLRVEARLVAEGRDAALAEAARFVARHPNSVHRARLERLGLLGDAR